MAQERGTGVFVKTRFGGGHEVTSYGGSVHLLSASKQNQRLVRAETQHLGHLATQRHFLIKSSHKRQHSERQTLHSLQEELKTVKYLDGDRRGKPSSQWDTRLIQRPGFRRRNSDMAARRRKDSFCLPEIKVNDERQQALEEALAALPSPPSTREANAEDSNGVYVKDDSKGDAQNVTVADILPLIDMRRTVSLLDMGRGRSGMEGGGLNNNTGDVNTVGNSAGVTQKITKVDQFALDRISYRLARFDLGSGLRRTQRRQVTWANNKRKSKGPRRLGQAKLTLRSDDQNENSETLLPSITGVKAYTKMNY